MVHELLCILLDLTQPVLDRRSIISLQETTFLCGLSSGTQELPRGPSPEGSCRLPHDQHQLTLALVQFSWCYHGKHIETVILRDHVQSAHDVMTCALSHMGKTCMLRGTCMFVNMAVLRSFKTCQTMTKVRSAQCYTSVVEHNMQHANPYWSCF